MSVIRTEGLTKTCKGGMRALRGLGLAIVFLLLAMWRFRSKAVT